MIEAMKEVVKFIWRLYMAMTHFTPGFAMVSIAIATGLASTLARYM